MPTLKSRKMIYGFLPVVCGSVASFCADGWILGSWISLGWRRPIQDWMMTHGAGSLAGYFGVVYIQIPGYAVAILGGVVVGLVAWRRWWQTSLIFSGAMFVFPYILLTMFGLIGILLGIGFRGNAVTMAALLDLLKVPLAVGGAWGVSRGRRRRAARLASGHCVKCGYDLRGDVSGRCPECAEPKKRPDEG